MDLTTTQAVLDHWKKHETSKEKDRRYEVESLRKDITKAHQYINDAIARYRKEKLRARSKAKASREDVFQELEDYRSFEEIRDAYGCEIISENEMYRLMHLWEMREASKTDGPYTDRVVEMLEGAKQYVFSAYGEQVLEYDEEQARIREKAEQIARENLSRVIQRKGTS